MIYLTPIIRAHNWYLDPIPSINGWEDNGGKQKFPTNVSVATDDHRCIFNVRMTDYMYVPLGRPDRLIYISNDTRPGSTSCNGIMDSNLNELVYENVGNSTTTLANGVSYKGLEDVRLVVWNDILYGIGFRPDVIPGKVIPQFVEYNNDYTIKRSWFLNTRMFMEKNWQPICDKPFTFVYDPVGANTIYLDLTKLHESTNPNVPDVINDIDTPDFSGRLCGSTQVITLPDETHVSICHTSHKYQGFDLQMHWMYNHYFVLYDKDMQKLQVSVPFHFMDECMEFACGMSMLNVPNDDVLISFTEYDGSPHVLTIPINDFVWLVDMMMNHSNELQNEPDIDCMVDLRDQVVDRNKLPYIMALECHNVHTPSHITLQAMQDSQISPLYKKRILAYLITRVPDNRELIKYYYTL